MCIGSGICVGMWLFPDYYAKRHLSQCIALGQILIRRVLSLPSPSHTFVCRIQKLYIVLPYLITLGICRHFDIWPWKYDFTLNILLWTVLRIYKWQQLQTCTGIKGYNIKLMTGFTSACLPFSQLFNLCRLIIVHVHPNSSAQPIMFRESGIFIPF